MDPRTSPRWTALAAGLLIMSSAGTVYSFGAYSSSLKSSLDLSQSALAYAALSANVGTYSGVAGFVFDRWGARNTVRLGAALVGVGYGALYVLLLYPPATGGAFLACVACFLWGHGAGYLDVASIGVIARAFPRHRGSVAGLLKSLYGLASSLVVLFAAYYASAATFVGILALLSCALPLTAASPLAAAEAGEGGPRKGGAGDDRATGGRLARAACRVVALALLALALALVRVFAPWSSTGANVGVALAVAVGLGWQTRVSVDSDGFLGRGAAAFDGGDEGRGLLGLKAAPAARSTAGTVDVPPAAAARSAEFALLASAALPLAGAGLMVINNLGQIVSARGGDASLQDGAVILVSVANCLARLATGAAADGLVARGAPRPALLAAASAASCLGCLGLYATGGGLAAAFPFLAIVGGAYGSMWTLLPTTSSDLWGLAHVGANYSLCAPSVVVGSLVFATWLAPAVYDANADGDGVCAGGDCFGAAFLAAAAANALGGLAAAGLARRAAPLYRLDGT